MSFKPTILSDDLILLPLYTHDGEIVVVDTIEKFHKVKHELFIDKIWGFDTETKPSFVKGESRTKRVALLQLTNSRKTFLFRLNILPMQPELLNFFSSPEYQKVGLAIRDDLKFLKHLKNFEPAGFIDLQSIVKGYGIDELGLRNLAAIVLNLRISKSQQLSNWEAETLTEGQIKYAATDSWASREIYLKLINSEING